MPAKKILSIMSFLILLLYSCQNILPSDLEAKKAECNRMLKDARSRNEYGLSIAENNQLIVDYENVKTKIIDYTKECDDKGIIKDNDQLVSELNAEIKKLKLIQNLKQLRNEVSNLKETLYSNYNNINH